MSQVIFLNTFYWPDEETRKRLDEHQEFLTFCNIQFEQEFRGVDYHIMRAKKEAVHRQARQRLGVMKYKECPSSSS